LVKLSAQAKTIIYKDERLTVKKQLGEQIFLINELEDTIVYEIPASRPFKIRRLNELFLSKLSHINVVRLYDVDIRPNGSAIVLAEYVSDLTVAKCIARDKEKVARSIAYQLLSFLIYLKEIHGRSHQHINPSTIYINNNGRVRIDFPDMLCEEDIERDKHRYMNNRYVDPIGRESIVGRLSVGEKGDIWSIGVLVCSIIGGYTSIKDRCLLHFVNRCLDKDREKRADILEALSIAYCFRPIHSINLSRPERMNIICLLLTYEMYNLKLEMRKDDKEMIIAEYITRIDRREKYYMNMLKEALSY
jgi:serine/threonine protein kinase